MDGYSSRLLWFLWLVWFASQGNAHGSGTRPNWIPKVYRRQWDPNSLNWLTMVRNGDLPTRKTRKHGADSRPYYAKHLDFSGKAFMLYKLPCNKQVRLSSLFSADKAQKVIFHSCWWTALEDFSLIAQITNNENWLKRSEFETSFQNIGSRNQGEPLDLIKYQRYSKLVNSTEQVAFSSKFSVRQEITHPISFFTQQKKKKNHIPKFLLSPKWCEVVVI